MRTKRYCALIGLLIVSALSADPAWAVRPVRPVLRPQAPVHRPPADAPSTLPARTGPLGQVVVSGSVPDEATRQQVLDRLQALYGKERVLDQIVVEDVTAPPKWGEHLGRALSPTLLKVNRGRLAIRGQELEVSGEVAAEADRQEVALTIAAAFNPTYAVKNGLRVSASEQQMVDSLLANRTVEFEPGSSVLLPAGIALLDDMADAVTRMPDKRIAIIGHTDSQGPRDANVALSLARADAVRAYLVTRKGLPSGVFSITGVGPDRPIASNDTVDGRARNRRIEFRVGR